MNFKIHVRAYVLFLLFSPNIGDSFVFMPINPVHQCGLLCEILLMSHFFKILLVEMLVHCVIFVLIFCVPLKNGSVITVGL